MKSRSLALTPHARFTRSKRTLAPTQSNEGDAPITERFKAANTNAEVVSTYCR